MKRLLKYYFLSIILFFIAACQKEISCEDCKGNKPPIANAGADLIIHSPVDSALLDGSASTDPDGTIVNWEWKKIAGPSSYTIRKPNEAKTIISSLDTGKYLFELTVKDNDGLIAKDTVQVSVNDSSSANKPPVANAGPDQIVNLPVTSIVLNGNYSTDPDNNIKSYLWKKISGPSSIIIANDTLVQTWVTGVISGTYYFELKVIDAGGLSDTDTLMIVAQDNLCGVSGRPFINAQLMPVSTLSVARGSISVAATNNKIVFAGGFNNGYESNVVDIYNLSTNSWNTASLVTARVGSAAIAAGNKIFYAGGGYFYSDYYANVDIYDATNDTWARSYFSENKTAVGAASIGNKVFFAGGYTISADYAPDNLSKLVEIYDITTNTWSVDTLPEARAEICGVAVGQTIYFAGGTTYNSINWVSTDRIDIYDNASQTWSTSTLDFLWGPVNGVAWGTNIYWTVNMNCTVEILNTLTAISSTASLYTKGYHHSVVKDGKVYFLNYGSNLFDIYDPLTNQWSVGVLPVTLPWGCAIISYNNTIYIAGGAISCTPNGNNGCRPVYTNQVWRLEF